MWIRVFPSGWLAAAALLGLVCAAGSANARVVTLRWTHPNGSAIEFYRVHVGSQSRQYTRTIRVGNRRSYRLVLGDRERAFVAVTAHIGSLSSDYSNERRFDPDPSSVARSTPELVYLRSGENPKHPGSSLVGALVRRRILVFIPGTGDIVRVKFYFDDPNRNQPPFSVKLNAPWDLAGTQRNGSPVPYDTTRLPDGTHTVTAVVDYLGGVRKVVHADFFSSNVRSIPDGRTSALLLAAALTFARLSARRSGLALYSTKK